MVAPVVYAKSCTLSCAACQLVRTRQRCSSPGAMLPPRSPALVSLQACSTSVAQPCCVFAPCKAAF